MIVWLDRSRKSMNAAAGRRAFIRNDGAAWEKMGDDLSGCERIERAIRNIGCPQWADMQRLFGRLHSVGEILQSNRAVLVWVGEIENSAILRRAPGWFVGICKETHWRTRTDQDQLLRAFHEFNDLFGQIGDALHLHAPRAALATRRERVAGDPSIGCRSDTAGSLQSGLLQCGATDQDHGLSARSECAGGLLDCLCGCDRRHWF